MRSSLRRTLERAVHRAPGSDHRPLSRRIISAIAGVASLALITGGLLVAGAAPAQAHDGDASANCQAITPNYHWYNANNGPNTITLTYSNTDGSNKVTQTFQFATDYTTPLAFSNPGVDHVWTVDVHSSDRPANNPTQWDRHSGGTTTGCTVPTPSIGLSVQNCSTVGGTTTVYADLTKLTSGHSYRVALLSGGREVSHIDLAKVGSATSRQAFTPPPGAVYTATVTDTALPSLTATSGPITALKCPQVGGTSVTIQPCAAVGGTAGLIISGTQGDVPFSANRSYVVKLGSGTAVSAVFTPTADTASHSFGVAPGSVPANQNVGLYDVTGGGSILVQDFGSNLALGTCPSTPTIIDVSVAPCTVGATSSNLTVTFGTLTAGREYILTVDNVEKARVTSVDTSKVIAGVAPGSHVVKLVDAAVTSVSAERTVDVLACASLPTVTATATSCAAPGGTGSLAPSFGGLTSGRSYSVTLTSGGNPVAGHASTTFVAGSTTYTPPAYTGLAPGSYSVKIADVLEPTATASSTQSLADCPAVPKLSAVVATCSWQNGTSTVQATASDVATGQNWTVALLKADSTGAFQPVETRSGLTTLTADNLRFTGVQNGATYRVTLVSQGVSALAAQATLTPAKCSVSAVEYHQDPTPRLASTGADALVPGIAALILLQLGVAMVAVAAIRRRREAGN